MPIELTRDDDRMSEDSESILYDEDGDLTIEGEVVEAFLNWVDWSEVFDEDVLEAVDGVSNEIFGYNTEGDVTEDDDSTVGAVEFHSIPGSEVVDVIDMDDLCEMFYYFIENLSEDSLSDKARKAAIMNRLVDESDTEAIEEMRKGQFKRIRKQAHGPAKVNAMLGAMINKGAIEKAAERGKGDFGSDYKRTGQYSQGSPTAVKKWRMFVKKNAAKLKKAHKTWVTTNKGGSEHVKDEAPKAAKGKKKVAQKTKSVGKVKVKKEKVAAKKASKGKAAPAKGKAAPKKGKVMSFAGKESVETAEGAALCGAVLEHMRKTGKVIVEKKQ